MTVSENSETTDRPGEVDAFVDAYAEFCQEADDNVDACETANGYIFDTIAATQLETCVEPDVPEGLETLAELPIGFNDVLDPDAIGRHFDEVVAQLHDRSATGSFYTPEEICWYMNKATIRPRVRAFLDDDVGVDVSGIDENNIEIEELTAVCDAEQSLEAIGHIASMSICDPACGSGQFIVGAIDEVSNILSAFGEQIDRDVAEPVWVWEASKTVYGVDLVHETVRMARLRAKLRILRSLPADAPAETAAQIRLSPHLEHQIKQGNSLIGISDMETVRDALSEDEASGQTTIAGGEWA